MIKFTSKPQGSVKINFVEGISFTKDEKKEKN